MNPAWPYRYLLVLVSAAGLLWAGCQHVSHRGGSDRTVVVTHDDTVITESCWIEIPPGTVIADTNHNGVIHIRANGVTVHFKPGSELRGATAGTPWDQLTGVGIRIEGYKAVTVRDARVHGFKNGLLGLQAYGLTLAGGDYSDNYRQHLRSTPTAEDGGDWLFPHHNDETRWRDEYGGAICIESSDRVTIHDLRVRRGQNGIVLDRVNQSAIYDNDCSFLSGWGLALWRSSSNIISRNAFDFCVRGHVEGVYNRGQDSAGILCFEQSNDNVFAENSVTHGGDGFFGFAGQDAIGEHWMNRERERLRKETGKQDVDDLIRPPADLVHRMSDLGCNRNLLIGNDFSYAPAHGIEMTFSEDNAYIGNRIVENAICGIWGGYSSRSRIQGNDFNGNGGMAYGLERGAINMEHSADNLIDGNRFVNNKCGIHLWWDNDGALLRNPGVSGSEKGISGNVIVGNVFMIDGNAPFQRLQPRDKLIVLQLRDSDGRHVTNNVLGGNRVRLDHPQAVEFAFDPGVEAPRNDTLAVMKPVPTAVAQGVKHPVGARAALRGRSQILMDDWGPWDHESPLVRQASAVAGEQVYELFGLPTAPDVRVLAGDVKATVEAGTPMRLRIRAQPGVRPYRAQVTAGGFSRELPGTLVTTEWTATFFPWSRIDPRTNLVEWRRLASNPDAVSATVPLLDFPYGGGGPKNLKISDEVTRRGPGPEHFGMIARTRLDLPAGKWRFKTLSDDGVRVLVDGKPVIENWGWHGPTPDEGLYEQATARTVDLVVEHFEIDGYSVLRFEIEPVEPGSTGIQPAR